MDWGQLSEVGHSLQTALASFSFGTAQDYMLGGHLWPFSRTAILFIAIVVTLFAILLLYGGNLQNTNIGPIAIRSRVQTAPTYFKAPRDIVTSVLEGKTVQCTFYMSYVDNRGKTKLVRISPKRFTLKLSALSRRLAFHRGDMFGFWNPAHDSGLQDSFVESGYPTAPEDNAFFMSLERTDDLLRRRQGDDDEIVTVSTDVLAEIAKGHRDFLRRAMNRFQKFYVRSNGRTPKNFRKAAPYLDLPDFAQDSNLYMRMHFSPNPLTHPDPQVKTTAWLTVLTSLFALLIQWLYAGF